MPGLDNAVAILNKYGAAGVALMKAAIRPLDATGKTSASLFYEVTVENGSVKLVIYGREYMKTLETGRGPRRSNTYGGFDSSMLEYMKAKGIGADLTEKKRAQLARFLTLKINKEGDLTFKKGGRIVYSDDLKKFVEELKQVLLKEYRNDFVISIRNAFNKQKASGS